jgi:acyl CoA:acetate/3-ketoacid CoA transferase beta subunit
MGEGFMKKKDYNIIELMAIVAAREIEDRAIIYIGTGIPMLAASFAKHACPQHRACL